MRPLSAKKIQSKCLYNQRQTANDYSANSSVMDVSEIGKLLTKTREEAAANLKQSTYDIKRLRTLSDALKQRTNNTLERIGSRSNNSSGKNSPVKKQESFVQTDSHWEKNVSISRVLR
jgi:hypothetical protein